MVIGENFEASEAWRNLSVLIVGCGSIGKRHARVLHGLGVRDLRACDPLPEQRASLLAQVPTVRMCRTYEAGLTDHPDTVLIGTPPWLHVPQAMQAIRAGCHVLSEKPLSDSTDGLDDLAALAAAESKKVMVAHCFRYHDGLLKARAALDADRIGRLVSVRALVGEHLPDVRPDYRSLFSAQHGGAFDLMHDIDLALWYAGLPVRQVYALSGSYSDIGIDAPDVAEILIGFEGRVPGDRPPGLLPAPAPPADRADRHRRRDHRRVRGLGSLHRLDLRSGESCVGARGAGYRPRRHVPGGRPRVSPGGGR